MTVLHSVPPPRAMANAVSLGESSSSPPSSPPQSPSPSERDCNSPGPVDANAPTLSNGPATAAHGKTSTKAKGTSHPTATASTATVATTGRKPGRKKKDESGANNDTAKPIKEKKTRKPRDPNAPPRKRQKLSDEAYALKRAQTPSIAPSPHQAAPTSSQSEQFLSPDLNPAVSVIADPAKPTFALIGKIEHEQKPNPHSYNSIHTAQQQQHQQPPPRPQSSGQRYDPIRSASAENALLRNAGSPTRVSTTVAPNARASPSIASLIDPPNPYSTTRHHNSALQLNSSVSTEANTTTIKNVVSPTTSVQPQLVLVANHINEEVISPAPQALAQPQSVPIRGGKPGGSQRLSKAETPPAAPSPKPSRQKEAPPTVPLGSGLLSTSAFGTKAEPMKKQYAKVPNQCIVIDVPMTQESGNYVNFIREVENKYGFDVAHPRLAEHRRRMAQMAAAGAALDPTLGDGEDMPLDESDGDSNVDMGGVEDDSTAAEGTKKKTRKKRANEYDKTDDFIDDTEQMWEEQAMASNNGYFVWSGPLIQEPSRPADEKPDGTVSKRGRGRGRGGSTRGETSGRGRGRGGRGSRGDGTTRKPRITKAERAKLEIEKQERENYAATAQKSAMQASADA